MAHTPPGGYGDEMPPLILEGCDEPLVAGAPDLRGTWRFVDGHSGGEPLAEDHPLRQHVERIEQAGDRFVVTTQGIIHDGFADGTVEHGVQDVMATDFTTPIAVAASYEDGALVLRPDGLDGVEVKRWREGDELVWEYFTVFTLRMQRIS
jgi:hypothetical protein